MPNMGNYVSIAEALFTRTQARVLGVLFAHPHKSFFLNEILKLTTGGSGAVRRELDRLVGAGLVTRRSVGNQVHFQADSSSMVFEELRGLVMKTVGVGEVLRQALTPRAGDITSAFIFGSVAASTDHAGSDIDLMLVSDTLGYSDVLALLEPFLQTLGRPVNPVLYTREQFARKQRDGKFLQRVMQQPRIQLIGKEAMHERTGEP